MSPLQKGALIGGVLLAVVAVPIVKQMAGSHRTHEVEVQPLLERTIRASTLASGFFSHEDKALISTEVIGRVQSVLVEEGQAVEQDQLLLKIDDRRFATEVDQLQALIKMREIDLDRRELQVDYLQNALSRSEQLYAQKVLNESGLEDATLEFDLATSDLSSARESLDQARAQLAQAQDQLDKTLIRSPFAGMVTSLDIKEGEMAISSTTNVPGSSLMTIADPASIHAEIYVDEADIASIALGQQAEVFAIAHPDTPVAGTVDFIATTAKVPLGRQSRSFAVKIGFDESHELSLKPGMSCRAEIFIRANEEVLAVPIQAVLSEVGESVDAEAHYIFVNDQGYARKVTVETGLADDDYQQVTGEITEGLSVVVGPDRVLRSLRDGDALMVAE